MGAEPVHPDGDEAVMRDLRRQVRATPPLRAGEQETLLQRSASGDQASRERLVAANLAMVIRQAEARQEKGLSVPDLVQEGSLGLVEAVRSFPQDGGDFGAFAEQRVGEQMDAAIAAEAASVRDAEQLVAAATDYERTAVSLHKTLLRPATEAEIAEKLEWTVERTRYVAQVVADARRRHDEELLAFIDPDAVDIDDVVDGE
ncbi:MAG TPA: sigma factor [Candidatus Dormibacteraeota bacterium]|jgi:RNA polymerase primary sigma factor|nr:sigma factor [Candidatus Dormibacteraeota bacterium]